MSEHSLMTLPMDCMKLLNLVYVRTKGLHHCLIGDLRQMMEACMIKYYYFKSPIQRIIKSYSSGLSSQLSAFGCQRHLKVSFKLLIATLLPTMVSRNRALF